jgi:prepilin-type processing-associated H-X9-DG protein
MAFVPPKDRVLEHSTSNSQTVFSVTGALDLSYNAFSASMSIGDTTIGAVVEAGVAFKVGVLTYSASNQITVTTSFASKGTFSSGGVKEVFMGLPAASALMVDGPQTLSAGQKSQARSNIGMADGHILGEGSTGAAASGEIGEEAHASGSGNFTTSNTAQNVCSLSVPAGDFDVYGYNDFSGSGSTSSSDWNTIISSVSTPTVSNPGTFPVGVCHYRFPASLDWTLRQSIGPIRVSNASPTTYYMHASATFTISTYSFNGYLRYRRAR